MIVALKSLHIAALILWIAGLIALSLMLARHEDGESQSRYARIRLFTHSSYTRLVTPSAIIAIAAGVPLIFLRDIFVPWLFAKLLCVAILVILHAYVGHVVLKKGEDGEDSRAPASAPLLAALGLTVSAILLLVLLKPELDTDRLPQWLQQPLGRQLPVDEVPS